MSSEQTHILETRLSEISDNEVRQFISELQLTTSTSADENQILRNFLISCVYREGLGKRTPIGKNEINNPMGILANKVSKLEGGLVYQICEELARLSGGSVESSRNSKLFTCLNRTIPVLSVTKPNHTKTRPRRISREASQNWGWVASDGRG